MGSILDLAERAWNGDRSAVEIGDAAAMIGGFRGLEALADDVAFVASFANVAALRTDEGLVLVDTGSVVLAAKVKDALRGWTDAPLHTAIYTHGHVDHVFGVPAWEEESRARGSAPPRVVAHEAVPRRFDRYKLTAGYNGHINMRQFGLPVPMFPTAFRYPDRTYRDREALEVGGVAIELRHARGETDDHTYVWIPSRRVLATGDLFIWAAPNCGNPQKVQRYPAEWAAALREMATLGATMLCPGHGPPIVGTDRVAQALTETAELLESLHTQTLALMNTGAPLDAVLAGVKAPEHLLARPYLRPVYDQPEFIVRNLWRLYGGWWDGNPAHLEPARESAIAGEIAALAGGASKLIDRAQSLAEAGELALACELAELAARAAPSDEAIAAARRAIYLRRAEHSGSVMARGIYGSAAKR
jgi:glyoxylase-like metal-dependent hydrolase (beta-lactamase superfamily II)